METKAVSEQLVRLWHRFVDVRQRRRRCYRRSEMSAWTGIGRCREAFAPRHLPPPVFSLVFLRSCSFSVCINDVKY